MLITDGFLDHHNEDALAERVSYSSRQLRRLFLEHVGATPLFFGANPAEVKSGPKKGLRVLATVEDLARELVGSLSDAQRKKCQDVMRVRGREIPCALGPRRRLSHTGRQADGLPAFDPRRGLGAAAVEPDLAGAQQLFEPAVAEARVMAPEPTVEADPVIIARDRDGPDAATHVSTRRVSLSPANRPATARITEPPT